MALWGYITLFLLSVLISELYGSCFFDRLKSESKQNAYGQEAIENYCEHSGVKHMINSNWTLPYPDCFNCGCNENGLECCGYGRSAGVLELPDDCELVKNTCNIFIVRKDDPSQPCDEAFPAKPIQVPKRMKHNLRRRNF